MITKTLVGLGLGFVALVGAQDASDSSGRSTVAFSDPSAPRKLIVERAAGGRTTIKGYNGKEVIVEADPRTSAARRGRSNAPAPPGMRRLGGDVTPVMVMEDHNVVTVRPAFGSANLTIQVPFETSVNVNSLAGAIDIDGVTGEIEASATAGPVSITNVSGSVVAHSMSGKITASINRVAMDKPTNLSTFNGDLDVTLPADTKANLKFKTFNGAIFADNDFDVKLNGATVATGRRTHDAEPGATRTGTINGGGPEIQLTTFNGKILLHKK